MAKYVRSKRRTIGGNHHHKGKAKKGEGKSKGKKKRCSTVKKCRAEIKKLETRIRKINSHKKKPKTRRRVRMRTPKELESMYMEGENGKGAVGRRGMVKKRRRGKLAENAAKGVSIGFRVAMDTLKKVLDTLKYTLDKHELLPKHMKGPLPSMDYREGSMVEIIKKLDEALKQSASAGAGMAVNSVISAAVGVWVGMAETLKETIKNYLNPHVYTVFQNLLNTMKVIVGNYPVEPLPQGPGNPYPEQYSELFNEKVEEFKGKIDKIDKDIQHQKSTGIPMAATEIARLETERAAALDKWREYEDRTNPGKEKTALYEAAAAHPNEDSSLEGPPSMEAENPFGDNLDEMNVNPEDSDEHEQVRKNFAEELAAEVEEFGIGDPVDNPSELPTGAEGSTGMDETP